MASTWEDLDASAELEQQVSAALRATLEPRDLLVLHSGTASGRADAGKADIASPALDRSLFILVELTNRCGAASNGESVSTTRNLQPAIDFASCAKYALLFAAPSIKARLRRAFLAKNCQRAAAGGRRPLAAAHASFTAAPHSSSSEGQPCHLATFRQAKRGGRGFSPETEPQTLEGETLR